MKKTNRLLVDLNAVLNAALQGGKDPDGATVQTEDGKLKHVNTALYGVERFFDYLVPDMKRFEVAPKDVIGVWDGLQAKQARQMHLPAYKAGREKLPQIHEQLTLAREQVNRRLRQVGVTTCAVKGREADDVIGYLAQELRDRPNIVSTVDGDLAVLVDDNTHIWKGGELDKNPFGAFPHKYITLYKALVGDPSDKIPGAKGFGDAAFVDLVRVFGLDGLDALQELVIEGKLNALREDVAEFPRLQKVLDDQIGVLNSWRVARLWVDDINTQQRPIEWVPAMAMAWEAVPEDDRVPAMREWYGTKTLVTAANYASAKSKLRGWVGRTEFVALDIETSSPEASDEWLEATRRKGSGDRIDALGHELTGMSLTFGDNLQHTVYMSVDHADTDNISVGQCREMVEVFEGVPLVAHNRAFEFQVLYRTWGEEWKGNGWHGFLPNCMDTMIEASYVDENLPRGLKFRSKQVLGYEQETYEQVTTMEGPLDVIPPGGVVVAGPFTKTIKEAVIEDRGWSEVDEYGDVAFVSRPVEIEPAVTEDGWYRKQYKMRELTGRRVLSYGCDDTICTAWLHLHFQTIMVLEDTWKVYQQVEILPQYLTSLAYVQGTRLNLPRLMELEREDKQTYQTNWEMLRDYLFTKGWVGTVKPVFEAVDVQAVKQVCEIVLGEEFSTRKRKLPAVAADLRETFPDNDMAEAIAVAVEQESVGALNSLVDRYFTGEPKINFDSPRQMQKLLYGVIGITPRIYNRLTPKERQDQTVADAFRALRRLNEGRKVEVTPELREIWMKKASTDDQAIDLALSKDELDDEQRKVLKAYLKIKEVTTRMKMFYNAYRDATHWTDGKVHPDLNQCATVTRRYSSSNPNIQQVPGKGEGAKMREVFRPHHDKAVFVSVDLSGQELRGAAHASQDEGMLSCYVGENLKDIHSLVAVQAAPHLWGEEITYEDFMAMRKSSDKDVAARASALRSMAKTCVFGSNYGAQAPKLALQLKTDEETAQRFLDALDNAFPRIKKWKDEVVAEGNRLGYSKTFLGARRHLSAALHSSNREESSKAERQLSNAIIQSSGAEQIKQAMSTLWKSGVFFRYDARFFAPIHDEICASVHVDHAVDFILELHAAMVQPYGGMTVPPESSLAIGRDFSCPIEIGTDFTDEQVQEAIDKLFNEGGSNGDQDSL